MPKYEFDVEGRNWDRFPLDMLRYDGCYPARSDDVEKIMASLMDGLRDKKADYPRGFVITLVSSKKPTEGRWKSFGWNILQCVKLK